MRVNSVVGAAMVCFGGVFAVVIGYRIDQQTLVIITGVAVGFVVAAIVVGLIAFFVIRQNRQPRQQGHQSPIADWSQPYHVQHPLARPAQLPAAPAGPQYDDSVTFTLQQPQRRWVAVDEARQ